MLKAGLNVMKEAGSRKFMSKANKLSVTNSHVSPKIRLFFYCNFFSIEGEVFYGRHDSNR